MLASLRLVQKVGDDLLTLCAGVQVVGCEEAPGGLSAVRSLERSVHVDAAAMVFDGEAALNRVETRHRRFRGLYGGGRVV